MDNNQINYKGISYCINRNIELISVVMLLSDYYDKYPYLKTDFSLQYLDEISLYFSGFLDHPVIKEFEKLIEKGFILDLPLDIMLFCDEEMKLQEDNLHEVNNRLGDLDILQITNFLKLAHEFSKISCFDTFFLEHYDFYNYVLRKNIDLIPDINFQDIFTEYYGICPKKMEVILSVTFGGVGFCIPGSSRTSIVLGTFNIKDNIPIVVDETSFIKMVLHEFSHSFVNPLIDKSEILIEVNNMLYNSLHKGYQSQYGNGKSLVSEQIVRAVTARIMSLYIDEEQGKKLMKFDKSQSFIAVEPLYFCLLNKYESNREKYHNFNEFMPELIATLEEI